MSQNAKQSNLGQYSYTQYDSIGRIVQVGQLVNNSPITPTISRSQAALQDWMKNGMPSADQITRTVYDSIYSPLAPVMAARNVRNRVAWTALYDTVTHLRNNKPATATYYSYDILGNVDTLVQDYKEGIMRGTGNRFKKLVYDYDLVSGKVNRVSFQSGHPDEFYHAYLYDAENRITHVLTSSDSINWDNDAFYSYYAHGPLARAVLGEQQVQGVNYAYTLQGWLKSINPPAFTGTGYSFQADGSTGSVVGANAYDVTLNYYNGDYRSVNGATPPDNGVHTALGSDYRPLFNGNISSMAVNIGALGRPLLYNYQYDQLNRLVGMDAWNKTGSNWNTISKLQDFQERISYDPNGNILRYKRNGNNSFASGPLGMDSLRYSYVAGTNRLDHINDSVPAGNYAVDVDDQPAGNYKYDSMGNMVTDSAEGISHISWTVYGKIGSMTRTDGSVISYRYDAGGHRISKTFTAGVNTTVTCYMRDAQGKHSERIHCRR